MPLIAYRCEKCHTVYEELHKTHNEPVPWCPECGGVEVKRLWHPSRPPLPIFKVKGFYITDYKGKNSQP
jgi:putative FmdB family regulatory protein